VARIPKFESWKVDFTIDEFLKIKFLKICDICFFETFPNMATAFFFAKCAKKKLGERKTFFLFIHSSKTMLDKAMLLSRFGNNLNKHGLALWESSFVSLEDKYEALCHIDMPEFKDVAQGIVMAFNSRTGSSCQTMVDIDKSLVIKEDLAMMEIRFSGLVKVVKTQDVLQGIQDATMKASQVYSKQEILRMTINLLVGFMNGTIPNVEAEQRAWADKNPKKMLDLSQRVPTVEEMQSLELNPDQIRQFQAELSE
jgi:hypothetical protein